MPEKLPPKVVELGELEPIYPVLRGGSRLRHFALRFWNQTCRKKNKLKDLFPTLHFVSFRYINEYPPTCTRDSDKLSLRASSSLANTSGYGARSNARSNSSS